MRKKRVIQEATYSRGGKNPQGMTPRPEIVVHPLRTPSQSPGRAILPYKSRMNAEADRAMRELVELSQEMGLYDMNEPMSREAAGLSEAQVAELQRRSEAYHRNPERAVPLWEALDRIERSLDDGAAR